MFRNIVVGFDGSATATEALNRAADLAAMAGAHLHIVSAYAPGTKVANSAGGGNGNGWIVGTHAPKHADGARRMVKNAAAALVAERALGITTHTVQGEPADVLVRVAAEADADLIVVGNKGMRGARRVLGSVPNRVAHKAPCGVMIVQTT
jgi:nucleotide-binding universal stress UspA family protein